MTVVPCLIFVRASTLQQVHLESYKEKNLKGKLFLPTSLSVILILLPTFSPAFLRYVDSLSMGFHLFTQQTVSKALPLSFQSCLCQSWFLVISSRNQLNTEEKNILEEINGRRKPRYGKRIGNKAVVEGQQEGRHNHFQQKPLVQAPPPQKTTVTTNKAQPSHPLVSLAQDSVFQVREVIGQARSRVRALMSGDKETVSDPFTFSQGR